MYQILLHGLIEEYLVQLMECAYSRRIVLEMIKKREKCKKELLQLTIDILDKRCDMGDYTGSHMSYAEAQKVPRSALYPLYNEQSNKVGSHVMLLFVSVCTLKVSPDLQPLLVWQIVFEDLSVTLLHIISGVMLIICDN